MKLLAGIDVTAANGFRHDEIALVLAALPHLAIDTRGLHADDRDCYQMRAITRYDIMLDSAQTLRASSIAAEYPAHPFGGSSDICSLCGMGVREQLANHITA